VCACVSLIGSIRQHTHVKVFDEAAVRRVALALVDALSALHSANLAHGPSMSNTRVYCCRECN
jgi:aminoglycoside phosphotransferase (APT) family kinase protein